MDFKDFFGEAEVLSFPDTVASVTAVRHFNAGSFSKANINIIGFGSFYLFVNGKRVGDDFYLPLNTDFHEREIIIREKPLGEVFGHRAYVVSYDVTDYVRQGANSLCVMLGNGWYSDERQIRFGSKKLVFSLTLSDGGSEEKIYSDSSVRYCEGFVKGSILTRGEQQSFIGYDDSVMEPDYDISSLSVPEKCVLPETNYLLSDCPPDRIVAVSSPVLIGEKSGVRTYDIGENTTGRVVLRLTGAEGETVRLLHSEEKYEDNTIDEKSCCWEQISTFECDGKEREASVCFTWNGFRYFSVEGPAEVLRFERIHTDVSPCASFKADNKVLNWIFNTFINTQQSNMHCGIPSDCPHIERRGYTGDGQLACNASMTVLDAEKFYRKWLGDISDCQDRISGHVQYTAPYTHSGGGPGGWGSAIVHVPYEFYMHYGDITPMREMLPQMLEYFRFLDDHSENLLVTSDVPDEWCLGDWCTATDIVLPEPFVNNYFYIRSINEILELGSLIGVDDSLRTHLIAKKEALINAVNEMYFNPGTGDYCNAVQGANAFAVDLGLGDERTFDNLVAFYENEGMFDTGIFGTDILIRILFERGFGSLAYRLLSSEGEFSFGNMMNKGATSLWEYWYGKRSHSHPMFGAVTAYLTEFLLGIRGRAGVITVSPVYPGCDEYFRGSSFGVGVSIRYTGEKAELHISTPGAVTLDFFGLHETLSAGDYIFIRNIR